MMAKESIAKLDTPQPGTITKRWYSADDLAEMFGVDTKTIWRWQLTGNMPKGIKLSPGCTRWPSDLIDTWIVSRAEKVA